MQALIYTQFYRYVYHSFITPIIVSIAETVERTTYIKPQQSHFAVILLGKKHLKYFQDNLKRLHFENSRAVKFGIQEYSSVKAERKKGQSTGDKP